MSQRISVREHEEFLSSLMTNADFDEVDELMADVDPPNRRSEKDVKRVLAILDDLETGDR